MKFIQLLLVFFLVACDSFFNERENCPWEKNKEFIRVVPFVDIDTVVSSVYFEYYPKYARFQTEYKDLGSEPLPVSIIAKGDTLNYALEIKNQENIVILVDTSNTPCASDSNLSKKGHDLYRVDAEKIHSCVFYLDQSCY